MHQIDLNQARQQLPELLDAAIRGEEIIITEDGRPLVKMLNATISKPRPQFGSARGLITIPDDFDEPLEDFKEYME
jgi:prevent-host-death family protein